MNQVANLTEEELKSKGIYYERIGVKFIVKESDITNLYKAQMTANNKLISDGVITMDMIINDINSNFLNG